MSIGGGQAEDNPTHALGQGGSPRPGPVEAWLGLETEPWPGGPGAGSEEAWT